MSRPLHLLIHDEPIYMRLRFDKLYKWLNCLFVLYQVDPQAWSVGNFHKSINHERTVVHDVAPKMF